MALMINDHCIACDACLPACPNQAIFDKRSAAESKGYRVAGRLGIKDDIYVIAHERCTECAGYFEEPQCMSVCPIGECCVPDPERPESRIALLERARRLHPSKMIDQDKVWAGVRG